LDESHKVIVKSINSEVATITGDLFTQLNEVELHFFLVIDSRLDERFF